MELLKTNYFNLIGTLISADVKVDNRKADGAAYVSVNAQVSSVILGHTHTFKVSFFALQLNKNGAENKLFKTYEDMPNMLGKRVSINGDLRETRFFSQDQKQLVSANTLSGRFISVADIKVADKAEFALDGFITKALIEKENKEGELYRYDITIAQSNYNDTNISAFTLNVKPGNKGIIDGLRNYHEVGSTISLKGNLEAITTVTSVQDTKMAFGEPVQKTYTDIQKGFYIVSCSEPITVNNYTAEITAPLIKAYNDAGAAIIARTDKPVEETPVAKVVSLLD